jgi:hypothetical protein
MFKRALFLLSLLPLVLCVKPASAQGYFQFLGPPEQVADRYTPRYGIRYNTQGYDQPRQLSIKKIKKLKKKGVPDSIIGELLDFPGQPDAIGRWIDDAFDQVKAEFMACGGSLASRARSVSPRGLCVRIMPTAFFEPYYRVDVAGVYYPSIREIRVLNIYYFWSGPYTGWLRHARDLIKWEMQNFFAVECKIQPEPRPQGWPCAARPLR